MNIAVVDDEVIVQKRLKGALEKEGHQVDAFASGEDLLQDLEGAGYDLIFLDVVLPGISGMEVLQQVKARVPDTEVILITGHASIDHAVAAIKKGAFHYVEKPLRLEEIRNLTRKALDHKRLLRENRQLKARLEPLEGWGEMIGISPRMKEVFHLIRKVAPLDCNVIVQGESGTGKELVARLIHRESERQDKPGLMVTLSDLHSTIMNGGFSSALSCTVRHTIKSARAWPEPLPVTDSSSLICSNR